VSPRPSVAALLATLLLPAAALAGPAPAASVLALESPPAAALPAAAPGFAVAVSPASPTRLSATRWESVRYRPRSRARSHARGPAVSSPVQFHAGFFDAEGDGGNAFVGGFRAGPQVDPHVQVGLGVDWMHKSENATAVLSEQPGPGGTVIVTRQELSESSSNLIPLMAFVQFNADEDLPVIPYFGIGGGYQLLFLSATDFASGLEYEGTFGGWAWQVWGGLALPLSGQARLTGEVFVNNGEAERDVDGPLGITYRETVSLDGTGARFGLQWGF
jgi:hypothetical protein